MKSQGKLLSALILVAAATYTVHTIDAMPAVVMAIKAVQKTDVNVKAIIGVQTCLEGGNCNQAQTMNAIGDPFTVDPQKASFVDLGNMAITHVVKLQVPQAIGGQTLYKFTTKDGQTVYLGLEMKPAPRPGTRYFTLETPQGQLTAGKDFNIVELYRFDESKKEWLRNNVIFVEKDKVADPLPVTILPSGILYVGQAVEA